MKIELDEGYSFGLGAFETIALREKHPVFLAQHLERLEKTLSFLKIPVTVTQEAVFSWLESLSGKLEGAMKLMVSEKNILMLLRHNPYDAEWIGKGFRVTYSPIRRNETSPFVYNKTMNYGDNILEKRRIVSEGLDEVLFLNSLGEVSEGSTANVFAVQDGKLYTPPVKSGLLPGVMRRYIMETFGAEEKVLFPEDLARADEVFLTNSLMGVMPVVQLEGRTYPAGEVTGRCIAAYAEAAERL